MSGTGRIQQVADARRDALGDTPARRRIGLLLDPGSFVELDGLAKSGGKAVGVVTGYGAVAGTPVAVFAQDRTQQGGGVGAIHAAKIGKVYDLALKTGIPVVGIYDSLGAKLDEGVAALAAYGDMLRQVSTLSGVVPQISLVLGTCAGTSAMMACSADFLVMSQEAELFMAAPDSQDAGKAAAAAGAGVAHIVAADDTAACDQARLLLSLLPMNNLSPSPVCEHTPPVDGEEKLQAACEAMPAADTAEILAAVLDQNSAVELLGSFGPVAYTALATMGGTPCGVVAATGKLCRDACAKIAKLVSVCDAYQLPVLTFLNTPGLASTSESERCGSIRDMARMAHIYAEATTPKIAVITGESYGSAYIALAGRAAGSDYTVAWPSAVISALEPKAAVALLHGDDISHYHPREQVEASYRNDVASAFAAAAGGYIDDVIDPAVTRPALLSALDLLSAKRVTGQPKKHGNLPL